MITNAPIFAATDAVLISITTSVAAVLMAAISAYFAYRSKVMGEESKKMAIETHQVVNSRMTELLELAKKSSTAEGILAGKAEEKAKRDAADLVEVKSIVVQKIVETKTGNPLI